jgi:hypothetical protein
VVPPRKRFTEIKRQGIWVHAFNRTKRSKRVIATSKIASEMFQKNFKMKKRTHQLILTL